jgi:TolA-binding protein
LKTSADGHRAIRQEVIVLRIFATLAAALLLSIPVEAQRELDSSPVQLRVTVVTTDEQPFTTPVRVQLVDASHMVTVEERFTDSTGQVTFRSVHPGRYQVKVRGIGIIETSENIEVEPHKTTQSIIHVRAAQEADNNKSPGGIVTLANLNIPEKARKEFDHGTEALDHSDLTEAAKHFEKAAKIYPNYASAFNNLGVISARQKDLKTARTYFEKAVSLDTHLSDAYLNLGKLDLNEQRFQNAKQPLERVLDIEPNNLEAMMMMANCELITGQNESAVAYARRIHALPHEKFAAAHLIAAHALEASHRPDQAIEEYKTFLNEAPGSQFAQEAREALTRLQSTN